MGHPIHIRETTCPDSIVIFPNDPSCTLEAGPLHVRPTMQREAGLILALFPALCLQAFWSRVSLANDLCTSSTETTMGLRGTGVSTASILSVYK